MKRFLIVLLTLSCATQIKLQAQTEVPTTQDDEVLRISTKLVTVPVLVKTRQGGYIVNLRSEDFRISEDGEEQLISHFETVNKPFTVTLMLDMSDSTGIELQDIQNAAIAFLNQLQPDDRALIVAFDKQVISLTPVTGDRKVLSQAIRLVRTGGGTALYDAIDTVINYHLKQIAGRKAIVILTDGIDTSSVRTTYDATVSLATEQYALIYPIQWDTANDALAKQLSRADNFAVLGPVYTTPTGEPLRKAYERGTRYLQLIARSSGGRFLFADNLKSLERSFSRIAEELRQQYSLGYYPKNQVSRNGKRRIKVSVSVPDVVVHARETYVYKPDPR